MTESEIAKILVARGHDLMQQPPQEWKSLTKEPDHALLVEDLDQYPHAFVIGCVVDRRIDAKEAWAIPHRLNERIGSFEFDDLYKLKESDWLFHLSKPTSLHWLAKDMAKCVHSAIQVIGSDYQGDASKMWSGNPPSATVITRFLQIHGVGEKIATMATNILARRFKIPFKEYSSIDISVDTHIVRVFNRLGLVDESAKKKKAIYKYKARTLHPEFPGLLDYACWDVGRNWCRPRQPICADCCMRRVCPTARIIQSP